MPSIRSIQALRTANEALEVGIREQVEVMDIPTERCREHEVRIEYLKAQRKSRAV
jgi:hypothetical protein